ncbi:MAG: glycerophosphodiester phosphodiesterase family protein [Bacteroidota bacterium]
MTSFDWQGHRGCRGLMPENTIEGFKRALEFEQVTTLEMDVVISADSQVIVSHEPWMSEEICSPPNLFGRKSPSSSPDEISPPNLPEGEESSELLYLGQSGSPPSGELVGDRLPQVEAIPYPGEDPTVLIPILGLTLEQVQSFDCGLKPHPRFPEQQKVAAVKPSLTELIDALPPSSEARPYGYNIELKYTPEWEAAGLVPDIPTFCKLVLAAVQPLRDRGTAVSLQCFHPPLLVELRRQDEDIALVYLDEFPERGDVADKFAEIDLVPQVYSPYYKCLLPTEACQSNAGRQVQKAQNLGALVIPWTVNTKAEMQALVEMGVDGIITDYPDRIP